MSNLYFSSNGFQKSPEAVITVNRNRIKQYESKVYLKDSQEFEVEIFNPCSYKIAARLEIQGEEIGTFVIRPGERSYIERYVSDSKKFKFSTYEVEDSVESKEAISKNGLVKVTFFKDYSSWGLERLSNGLINNLGSLGGVNSVPYVPYNNSGVPNNSNIMYCSSGTANNTLSFTTRSSAYTFTNSTTNASIQTGLVEKGSESKQKFTTDYGNYGCLMSSVELYIKPFGEIIEADQVRLYCTSCGTRIKKQTWKFCPSCGEKL